MKAATCIILFIITATISAQVQKDLILDKPNLKSICIHVYGKYQLPGDSVKKGFAKTREGWYMYESDAEGSSKQINRQPVYLDSFLSLNYPLREEILSDTEVQKLPAFRNYWKNFFQYERCAYYGYPQWSWDVIMDYEGKTFTNPYEMESYARACAAYANGFLSDQYGYLANPGNYHRRVRVSGERPSDISIDSFLFYEEKVLSVYEKMVKLYPDYQTLVGNIHHKLSNEYMDIYLKLMYYGKEKQGAQYLKACRYTSSMLSFARNYLDGLAPGAILFTNGDNDTYPLWFLQLTEGYRKDVSVLNYSLLSFKPYQRLLLKGSCFAPLAINPDIVSSEPGYITATDGIPDTIYPVSDITEKLFAFKISPRTYPMGKYSIAFKHNNSDSSSFIYFPITNGYLYEQDVVFLDIVNRNIQSRPVYWVKDLGDDILFKSYTHDAGIVNRLDTVEDPNASLGSETANVFLLKTLQPLNHKEKFDLSTERTADITFSKYYRAYTTAVYSAYMTGDVKTMYALIEKAGTLYPGKKYYYDEVLFYYLWVLYHAGAYEEAKALRIQLQDEVTKRIPLKKSEYEITTLEDLRNDSDYKSLFNYVIESIDQVKYAEEFAALSAYISGLPD